MRYFDFRDHYTERKRLFGRKTETLVVKNIRGELQFVESRVKKDKTPPESPASFYKRLTASALMANVAGLVQKSEFNQLMAEKWWHDEGRPTFQIHPRMIDILGDLQFPEMPADLMVFPHGSYVVSFPEDERLKFADGKHQLRSAICYCPTQRGKIVDLTNVVDGSGPPIDIIDPKRLNIIVWFDIDEASADNTLVYTYRQLEWDKGSGDSIEVAFRRLEPDSSASVGLQIPQELQELGVKIVLGTGFLAQDNSELISPVVLNKDLMKLRTATPQELVAMAQRAERIHGMKKFIIGDERYIPTVTQQVPQHDPSQPSGRKLKHQHLVRIHWKVVRHGPGMSLATPRLILPYTRGKGLPMMPPKQT